MKHEYTLVIVALKPDGTKAIGGACGLTTDTLITTKDHPELIAVRDRFLPLGKHMSAERRASLTLVITHAYRCTNVGQYIRPIIPPTYQELP